MSEQTTHLSTKQTTEVPRVLAPGQIDAETGIQNLSKYPVRLYPSGFIEAWKAELKAECADDE